MTMGSLVQDDGLHWRDETHPPPMLLSSTQPWSPYGACFSPALFKRQDGKKDVFVPRFLKRPAQLWNRVHFTEVSVKPAVITSSGLVCPVRLLGGWKKTQQGVGALLSQKNKLNRCNLTIICNRWVCSHGCERERSQGPWLAEQLRAMWPNCLPSTDNGIGYQ